MKFKNFNSWRFYGVLIALAVLIIWCQSCTGARFETGNGGYRRAQPLHCSYVR